MGRKVAPNLPSNLRSHRRLDFPNVMKLSLMTRMPTNRQIIGRFMALNDSGKKSRKERLKSLCHEIEILWANFNFPIISKAGVEKKLDKMLVLHQKIQKKNTVLDDQFFDSVFDVTKMNGLWLSSKDKEFHSTQISSNGTIGYCTRTPVPSLTIHPSKRIKLSESKPNDVELLHETDDADDERGGAEQ